MPTEKGFTITNRQVSQANKGMGYRPGLLECFLRIVVLPTRTSGAPDDLDLPDGFEDELLTETLIIFNWRDRLALLLRPRMWVSTRTATEHLIGKTQHRGCGVQVGTER